jgi:hypothetical protein
VTTRLAEEASQTSEAQAPRDERPPAGDEAPAPSASGAPDGTGGKRLRVPTAAYAGAALFILAATTVNALSDLHDIGPRIAAWKPFAWEYSSAVFDIALLPAIGWLATRECFSPGRRLRSALFHLLGTIAYCLIHVGGSVLVRKFVYASFGERYAFGSIGEWIYEYRKDALYYCAFVAVFILTARPGVRAEPAKPVSEVPRTFDIRDGTKLIRTPVAEILSARSAGNYVEFHLADGRRPLTRATLASVEAALAPLGFVRTHRSWLVNAKRVRVLAPEGSGDWRVELEGGAEAPLSRRFPAALETLRKS